MPSAMATTIKLLTSPLARRRALPCPSARGRIGRQHGLGREPRQTKEGHGDQDDEDRRDRVARDPRARPTTMRNSLRKMPKGGMAEEPSTARTSIGPLHGRAPTPPRILAMSLVANLRTTDPAPKNAVPLAAAWAMTWSSTPTIAMRRGEAHPDGQDPHVLDARVGQQGASGRAG